MKNNSKSSELIPVERIQSFILIIRGQKVILDRDLSELYGVSTGNLNKAVERNIDRFPQDFAFRLSKEEFANLIFQFGTSRWGGTRKPPRVFTEHGALMLASVLNSPKAIEVSVYVVRAFVRLREYISSHAELARKLGELERKVRGHDDDIQSIVTAIRQLMAPPNKRTRRIGFKNE
jgi:hypothetical protein